MQGLIDLMNAHEAQSSHTEPKRKQFLEVAGSILLDVEMTVMLVSQGKVGSRRPVYSTSAGSYINTQGMLQHRDAR